MITIANLRFGVVGISSLAIGPGMTSIIGPNGSGKTTLLKILAGIVLPESGSVLIDGAPPREIDTGWINEFPDRNILFETVEDEIASPLRFRHTKCKEIDSQVSLCMETLGITHLSKRQIRGLSGGEKVLVALATALVHHPLVLILDECDSHLDADLAGSADLVIRKSDVPYIICCTQDMERASCGDHLVYLENGSVCFAGHRNPSLLRFPAHRIIHCHGSAHDEDYYGFGACYPRGVVTFSTRNFQ